jgi:hypothetical protein
MVQHTSFSPNPSTAACGQSTPSLLPQRGTSASHLTFEAWRLETLNRPVRSRVDLRLFNEEALCIMMKGGRSCCELNILMFHTLVASVRPRSSVTMVSQDWMQRHADGAYAAEWCPSRYHENHAVVHIRISGVDV